MSIQPFARSAAACAAALLTLTAGTALAAEGGASPYLKGYRDIAQGFVPPEGGVYMRNDVIYYSGSIDRTVLAGQVQVGLKETMVYEVPSFTFVTDKTILGGATYAFGFAPTLASLRAEVSASTAAVSRQGSDDIFALGDTAITPIVLGWHAKNNLHWNVGLSILAPTGSYDSTRLANTSLHYWAVIPEAGLSYIDPVGGWDASAGIAYTLPFENTATHYQSGQIFHLDAALTKAAGPWRLGMVGYAMFQATDDSGDGAVLGANRSQVIGLGPIVSYGTKFGKQPINMLVKWDHEFDAHYATHGDTVTAAFSLKF